MVRHDGPRRDTAVSKHLDSIDLTKVPASRNPSAYENGYHKIGHHWIPCMTDQCNRIARETEGPVTLRNFYSNLQRNTVALQAAEEVRGVTGYLGNLQRIFFCCAQRCTK